MTETVPSPELDQLRETLRGILIPDCESLRACAPDGEAGIVASVIAQAGQTLQVGDVLLVLEAMKMETQVTAPMSGKVADIKVKAGDGVQSGQILVEFE